MKYHILLLMLLIVACEAIPEPEFTDRPVVCCYLSAGETPTLTIEKLIPFQSDAAFSAEDIEKQFGTITDHTAGTDYILESIGGGAYRNDELVAETGHS